MSRESIFVIQPFTMKGGKLVAIAPIPAPDEADAKRRARSLKSRYAGIVAFSRIGNAETGEYGESVILARYGMLPPEIDDL